MPTISAEQVAAQVQTFWNAFCGRSGQSLEQMYFPSAIVFGTFARRSESARLMLARRLRKFGNVKSFANAKLGPIEVQIAGDVAAASYPYHFHLTKTNNDGSLIDLDAPYSRGTQVFQLDPNGTLRILHEHFSVAEAAKSVLIPRDDPRAQQSTAAQRSSAGMESANASLKVLDTGSFPAAAPIQADEVRSAIRHCWQALSSKSKEQLEAIYFPTAIFYGADARRSEPARLAIVRRAREFFSATSSVNVDLSPIDVQMAGTAGAIASYTFEFHMVRQLAGGKSYEKHLPFCRATAVFRRDENGALRIFHEHQSAVDVGSTEELPTREAVLAR